MLIEANYGIYKIFSCLLLLLLVTIIRYFHAVLTKKLQSLIAVVITMPKVSFYSEIFPPCGYGLSNDLNL